MRRTALLFLLIALCITAAPVRAQTSIHVRGGAALPLSPNVFTETAAPSLALEAGPAFALTDRLRLIATVGHHRFSLDGPFLSDPEALTVWSLAADLRVQLRPAASTVVPFITVGASANRVNHAPEQAEIVCFGDVIAPPCPSLLASNNDPEARLGLQAGVGVSAWVAPALRLFVQSEYAGLFVGGDVLRFVPVLLGVQLRPFR